MVFGMKVTNGVALPGSSMYPTDVASLGRVNLSEGPEP